MKLLSSLKEADLAGKRVIVRGDLDITDFSENDIRLQRLVPTVKFLLENKATVILIGHIGRPDGKAEEKYSLKQLQPILEKMIGTNEGWELKENLRFDPREEQNDESFAKELSSLGDIYVNEAFSVSHRKHASIVGIPKFLPSYAGLNLENEIMNLSKVFEPIRPLVILISGTKDDKLTMIEPLSNLADKVLVGGRLPDLLGDKGLESIRLQGDGRKVLIGNLIMDKEDITLNTIDIFSNEVMKAKTVVLAGVLGRYEDEGHSQGTRKVFTAVANSKAFKIVGGGDSLNAINKYGLTDKFDWVSVGGGAMLEFLTKKTLPGIEALQN
ncbi:MAG: phosphoglycerate kinase [bacterium]|nr:MAG: phosphoglycerate kinase [bacterium]